MSATFIAGAAVAALVAGCGGGSQGKPPTSTAEARSPHTSATASPVASPATPPITTSTSVAPSAAAYWPYAKLVASLAGRTITVSNATVRLDPTLVECNGEGAVRKTGSTREWSRYTCTQTIFQGGADHDVTFDVVISSATQLTVTSPRTGPE